MFTSSQNLHSFPYGYALTRSAKEVRAFDHRVETKEAHRITSLVALASPLQSFSTDTRSPRTLESKADPVDTSRDRQRCNASPSSDSSLDSSSPADPLFMAFGKRDSQLQGKIETNIGATKQNKRVITQLHGHHLLDGETNNILNVFGQFRIELRTTLLASVPTRSIFRAIQIAPTAARTPLIDLKLLIFVPNISPATFRGSHLCVRCSSCSSLTSLSPLLTSSPAARATAAASAQLLSS